MRVYFYTGGFTHTLYREQMHALPAGVSVIASSPQLFSEGIKEDIAKSRQRSYHWRVGLNHAILRGATNAGVPNIRYVRPPECDLIHSAQYPLLNLTPWIVDFEDASVFAWYHPVNLSRPLVRAILQRIFRRDSCRWILPWTDAARISLLNALDCGGFEKKIRVVYPAIRPVRNPEMVARQRPVRLLFVGTAFYLKGGVETLLAYRKLRERIDIELTMVSNVPAEVVREYDGVPGVTFRSRIPPDELERLYSSSDLLVAPLHTDTFGFVLLEAFARGLPCVVTRQFATPEIVTHGENGLVIDNSISRFGPDHLPRYSPFADGTAKLTQILRSPPESYVDALSDAIEQLAADPKRRYAMAQRAFQTVSEGRFSIAQRRHALGEIYGTTPP